jgi:hypothetical protein
MFHGSLYFLSKTGTKLLYRAGVPVSTKAYPGKYWYYGVFRLNDLVDRLRTKANLMYRNAEHAPGSNHLVFRFCATIH